MYNSVGYWSEYIQKEKYAICVCLRMFIVMLSDHYRIFRPIAFEKESLLMSNDKINDTCCAFRK